MEGDRRPRRVEQFGSCRRVSPPGATRWKKPLDSELKKTTAYPATVSFNAVATLSGLSPSVRRGRQVLGQREGLDPDPDHLLAVPEQERTRLIRRASVGTVMRNTSERFSFHMRTLLRHAVPLDT